LRASGDCANFPEGSNCLATRWLASTSFAAALARIQKVAPACRWAGRRRAYAIVLQDAMTLTERIQSDLTQAMKAKDELRLSVLRMMKSALKNKEIEKIRPLDDAEALQVLNTLVKQRRESVEMFGKGGRQDLVDKETKEIAIIETYLPAGASEAEMDAAIAAAIAETGANSPKQMGGVIKAARAHLEGKTVDGKALSDRVRDRLSKPA
jgi:uncharacterized protein